MSYECCGTNRPFTSSPAPLYHNEVKCLAFDEEMIFHSHANKTHFSPERLFTWPHFESEGFELGSGKCYSFIPWYYLGYNVHWIICILLLFSHYQAQKDSPDVQWKVNWILYTVFLLTCLFKAWENSLHFATRPLVFPRSDVWESSPEIPYWWPVTTQIWVEADRLLDRLPDKRLDKLPDKRLDKRPD